MKALDTAALLEVLAGTPGARKELSRLRGEELATTEASLLELTALSLHGPSRAVPARLAAISRLRRRLTVIPIDSSATDAMVRRSPRGPPGQSDLLQRAANAALEAAGCAELLTGETAPPDGRWSFKTRRFGIMDSKSRKSR